MYPLTFETPAPISVALDLHVADVRITASEGRTETVVDVRPHDPAEATDVKAAANTRVEFADGVLTIVNKRPRNVFAVIGQNRVKQVDIVIQLPADSAVHGNASVGSLVVEGVLGDVRFKNSVGDILLEETAALELRTDLGVIVVDSASGPADVQSGSGEVRIGAVDGPATVKNGNGPTSIGLVTGDARLKASNGSISVERALGDVTATCANGDVRIGEVVRGKAVVTSANGRVEVGVREGTAAWLELSTSIGKVYNELDTDASAAPGDGGPDHSATDTVELHASTKLGDVIIRRVPRVEADA